MYPLAPYCNTVWILDSSVSVVTMTTCMSSNLGYNYDEFVDLGCPHAPRPEAAQGTRGLPFVTFSCDHRSPLLPRPGTRRIVEETLERVGVGPPRSPVAVETSLRRKWAPLCPWYD